MGKKYFLGSLWGDDLRTKEAFNNVKNISLTLLIGIALLRIKYLSMQEDLRKRNEIFNTSKYLIKKRPVN